MNETEIERLVVRLTGDGSQYQKMMEMAATSTKAVATQVEAASKRIEGISSGLKGFAAGALGLMSSLGLASSFRGAFEKFEEKEKAMIGMRTAIEASGRSAAEVTPRYLEFAKAIEAVTTRSKGEVMGLLRMAEVQGLQGAAAENAVRTAIGMSKALGMSAESAIAMVAALQRGNVHMLQHMLHMRGEHDQSVILARAQQMVTAGLKAEEEEAKLLSSQIVKIQRAFGELTMEIGKYVSEAISPAVSWTKKAVDWFKELDPAIKKNVATFAAILMGILAFNPAMAALKYLLAPIGAMLTTAFSVLGLLFTPVGALTAGVLGLTAAFLYFTNSGGAAIQWFTDQWDTLSGEIQPAIDGIKDSIEAGDFGLAFDIAWTQIQISFRQATYNMEKTWNEFTSGLAITWNEFTASLQVRTIDFSVGMSTILAEIMHRAGFISRETADTISSELTRISTTAIHNIQRERDANNRAALAMFDDDMTAMAARLEALQMELGEGLERAADRALTARDRVPPVIPAIGLAAHNAAHEVGKFDAALRGSSEAVARIAAFQDKMTADRTATSAVGVSNVPGAEPGAAAMAGAGSSAADPWRGSVLNLLGQIATATGTVAARSTERVEAAGL